MKFRIAVVAGDGVGPEVTREAVNVLKTVSDVSGQEFEFSEFPIGGTAVDQHGQPLPIETLDACLASDAVLLGSVGGPKYDALPAAQRPETGLLQLRQALGCFANLRPAVAYDATAACSPIRADVRKGADVLIVRELLGGLYFGEPRGTAGDGKSAFNTLRYSEAEVERVAHVAFKQAMARTKKVTSVDKANVLETSRLWRAVVTKVASQYPAVTLEHAYVDSFAMSLVTNPAKFDVVLTENMFGDILSDEAAVLSGSLGLLPSASIGGKVALYEPIHGSAPDIAGKGIANPIGAIASAAMLLRHSAKMEDAAEAVEAAIRNVINAGALTRDLCASDAAKEKAASTRDVGAKVTADVADLLTRRIAYHAV